MAAALVFRQSIPTLMCQFTAYVKSWHDQNYLMAYAKHSIGQRRRSLQKAFHLLTDGWKV